MKSVLISIQPKWCELIASGRKTVEVRKTAPKEGPFKVYIYQSEKRWMYKILPFLKRWQTKVIGEFICDKVEKFSVFENGTVQNWNYAELCKSCLSYDEISSYVGNGKIGYAWHISELEIYAEPRNLGEFSRFGYRPLCGYCFNNKCKNYVLPNDGFYQPPECKKYGLNGCTLTRPPQSWCYVKEDL